MNQVKVFILFCCIAGPSIAFDKDEFVEKCVKDPFFFKTFYIEELQDCMVCQNVTITEADAETFKSHELRISNENCVVFYGGDIGVVNSDFFKQFPNTEKMSFENVKINLKSSDVIKEHLSLQVLGIVSSDVEGNNHTNALHSLKNLKKFVLNKCILEKPSIDKMFLEKSSELKDVTFKDSDKYPADTDQSILKNIDEDALDNQPDLEKIYFLVENMKNMPSKLFKDKAKLEVAEIDGSFENFPSHLPESLKDLSISFHKFKKLTRNDLRNLKKLEDFCMYWSDLEEIEEDAFDDLENLKYLNLHHNQIKEFSSRHLKNNNKIVTVQLSKNKLTDLNLSELGLRKDDSRMNFDKNDSTLDNVISKSG